MHCTHAKNIRHACSQAFALQDNTATQTCVQVSLQSEKVYLTNQRTAQTNEVVCTNTPRRIHRQRKLLQMRLSLNWSQLHMSRLSQPAYIHTCDTINIHKHFTPKFVSKICMSMPCTHVAEWANTCQNTVSFQHAKITLPTWQPSLQAFNKWSRPRNCCFS